MLDSKEVAILSDVTPSSANARLLFTTVKKDESRLISPAFMSAPSDIANEVAVTLPVIVALVAVRFPARSTLKGAEEKVLLPRCMPSAVLRETLVAPVPAVRDVDPKVNPPIVPDVEVTEPVIVALVAVRAPAAVTRNGALENVA